MKKKPITKKEAEEIRKQLRWALKRGIESAEDGDAYNTAAAGYLITHFLAELRKGLHPKN